MSTVFITMQSSVITLCCLLARFTRIGNFNVAYLHVFAWIMGEFGETYGFATHSETTNATTDDWFDDYVLSSTPSSPPSEELFQNYPTGLLYFATAACIVFILVGIPGNLITIIALARCKKVRNATAVFIINLSLSDLLFCCFNLPLAASTFWNRAWTHGELLCRLYPLLRYGLLAVSLFTVLTITINRYVMIGHPRIYPRIYRRKYLGVMVAGTWLGAFCSLIPTWRGKWGQFGLDRKIGSCSILPDKDNTSPKEFLFIMAFVVPCISIVVCYARIFYIVRKTALRSHDTGNALGNSMHCQSVRALNNNQCKRIYATNNNKIVSDGTDVQLLAKSDDVSGESGRCIERASELTVSTSERNEKNHFCGKNLLESDNSSALLSHSQSHGDIKSAMKFIDTTIGKDYPPTLSTLQNAQDAEEHKLTANDRNLSNVSISRTVEFIEANGERHNSFDRNYMVKMTQIDTVDSAIEESTSSTENHQVYHIKSNDNCLQILAVQVEPSSSSGIDLPMDNDSPPRRMKRSYTSSIRRSKKNSREQGNLSGSSCTIGSVTSRKASGMTNTSGASILYPGRMTTKDRRLLKMILVIFVSFVTCYFPITSTKIIRSFHNIPVFHIMGYILIYLTTCINPIIYVVMSSEYRQAYWNLLTCRINKRSKRGKNYNSNRNHFQKNSQIKVAPNKT